MKPNRVNDRLPTAITGPWRYVPMNCIRRQTIKLNQAKWSK